jgi:hypothetical protein
MSLYKPNSALELSAEGIAIVGDQLARDIAETGAGVGDVTFGSTWKGTRVTYRQWEPYGIVMTASQDLDLGSTVPKDEEALRKAVTRRFSRILRRQAELSRRFGSVGDDRDSFDPSLVTIDGPLAEMLGRFHPTAFEPLVMRALRKETHFDWSGVAIDKGLSRHGVTGLHIEVNRSRVQGQFALALDNAVLAWKNGSLSILNGGTLPKSTLVGLRGKPLSKVVQHPLFDPDLEITAAGPVRKEGIDGTVLTLKDHAVPLDQAIARVGTMTEETT